MDQLDGVIGRMTLAAEVVTDDSRGVALGVLTAREEFMQDIMDARATQRRMLGWWRRTTKLQRLLVKGE